jgi:hypothetical protein
MAISVPVLREIRPKLGKRGSEPIRAYLFPGRSTIHISGILRFTYHMPDLDSATHCERGDSPENCEIAITREMVDAGLTEYALFDSRDPGIAVVCAIYKAMAKIDRSRPTPRKPAQN